MRKSGWMIAALFLVLSGGICFAEVTDFPVSDPDVEGRIANIDYGQSEIVVSNILYKEKNVGGREKRVKVKQGMINNYKLQDYVKIKLDEGNETAAMIELVKR